MPPSQRPTSGRLRPDGSIAAGRAAQPVRRHPTEQTVSTWGRRGLSRSVRALILARDNGMCQLGYPGCSYFATEVDDIIPVSVLGVGREDLLTTTGRASARRAIASRPKPTGWPL